MIHGAERSESNWVLTIYRQLTLFIAAKRPNFPSQGKTMSGLLLVSVPLGVVTVT